MNIDIILKKFKDKTFTVDVLLKDYSVFSLDQVSVVYSKKYRNEECCIFFQYLGSEEDDIEIINTFISDINIEPGEDKFIKVECPKELSSVKLCIFKDDEIIDTVDLDSRIIFNVKITKEEISKNNSLEKAKKEYIENIRYICDADENISEKYKDIIKNMSDEDLYIFSKILIKLQKKRSECFPNEDFPNWE